jgi:hypothetical protein
VGRWGSRGCTRCHSPSGTTFLTRSSTTSSVMPSRLRRLSRLATHSESVVRLITRTLLMLPHNHDTAQIDTRKSCIRYRPAVGNLHGHAAPPCAKDPLIAAASSNPGRGASRTAAPICQSPRAGKTASAEIRQQHWADDHGIRREQVASTLLEVDDACMDVYLRAN